MARFMVSLIVIFSLALNCLYATTPKSKFWFGLYTYDHHHLRNGNFDDVNGFKSPMDLWYNYLGMNTFLPGFFNISEFAEYTINSKTDLNDEYKSGEVRNILEAYNLRKYSEGHYLFFKPNHDYDSILTNSTSKYLLTKSSTGYRFENNNWYRIFNSTVSDSNSYCLVSGLKINGSINNTNTIRPKELNTIIVGSGVNYERKSKFYLRISSIFNSGNIRLRVKIVNSNIKIHDPNDCPKDTTFLLNSGTTLIPFSLVVENNAGKYGSAFEFGTDVKIYSNIPKGSFFKLNNLTIYDATGRNVVENISFLDSILNPEVDSAFYHQPEIFPKEIIYALSDESFIGNFIPTKSIITYINSYIKSAKIYTTHPSFFVDNSSSSETKDAYVYELKRFINTVKPDYLAPDIYPFYEWMGAGIPDTIYSPRIFSKRINETLIYRLKIVSDEVNLYNKTASKKIKPIFVAQIHSWNDGVGSIWSLRVPTSQEIFAETTIPLMLGYSGVMFWQAGPSQVESEKINTNLYKSYNEIGDTHDSTNIVVSTKSSLKNIFNQFNDSITVNGNKYFLSDFLSESLLDSKRFNFVKGNDVSSGFPFGTDSLIINWLRMTNGPNGALNINGNRFFGINTFSKFGKHYLTIADLRNDTSNDSIWININYSVGSSQTGNLLKVTDLTDRTIELKTFPLSGILSFPLGSNKIKIFEISYFPNTSATTFPKSKLFGVTRVEDNLFKLYLDSDFNGYDNYHYSKPPYFQKMITLDYNNDGATDFCFFQEIKQTSKRTLKYEINLQTGPGIISNSSIKSLTYDYVPFYGTSSIIYPLTINNNFGFIDFKPSSALFRLYYYFNNSFSIKSYTSEILITNNSRFFQLIYNNVQILAMFSGTTFIVDKNNNQILENSEKLDWSQLYLNNNYNSTYPVFGDWSEINGNNSEIGLYGSNSILAKNIFNLSLSNDLKPSFSSIFQYTYGNPNDIPFVWTIKKAPIIISDKIESQDSNIKAISYSIYPNPFNPITRFSIYLPIKSTLKIEIFNLLGQNISLLANGAFETGRNEFEFNGEAFASGAYLYRITVNNEIHTGRIILLK